MRRILAALAAALAACGGPPAEPVLLRGEAMGTTWEATFPALPKGTTAEGIRQGIAARFEEVEQRMSHWRKDSDLSRFNRARTTDPVEIPPELAEVIREALRVSGETGGAFDVTAAPLVDLWGFGPAGPRQKAPPGEAIEKARRHVGFRRLTLVENRLAKDDPAVSIDLSAIAKGFAIDRAAAWLDGLGAADYLVELGGELKARGKNPQGKPWQVGLERPDPSGTLRRVVPLRNGAIATSGDYRQFFTEGETRHAHILDPRTGRPVGHRLASVSVLHTSAMRADALATALMVMGPERGFDFALKSDLAASFVVRDGAEFVEKNTPQFPF